MRYIYIARANSSWLLRCCRGCCIVMCWNLWDGALVIVKVVLRFALLRWRLSVAVMSAYRLILLAISRFFRSGVARALKFTVPRSYYKSHASRSPAPGSCFSRFNEMLFHHLAYAVHRARRTYNCVPQKGFSNYITRNRKSFHEFVAFDLL